MARSILWLQFVESNCYHLTDIREIKMMYYDKKGLLHEHDSIDSMYKFCIVVEIRTPHRRSHNIAINENFEYTYIHESYNHNQKHRDDWSKILRLYTSNHAQYIEEASKSRGGWNSKEHIELTTADKDQIMSSII